MFAITVPQFIKQPDLFKSMFTFGLCLDLEKLKVNILLVNNTHGFLHQTLGARFDHCIPQTGVLKFGHGDVLLETGKELKRLLNAPVGDDFAPVYLVGKLFEQTPVVVDVVAIGECLPIPLGSELLKRGLREEVFRA